MPPTILPSPCVGICKLDPETGWCLGCARSSDELTRWRDLSADAQGEIWADLPRRKAALGLAFRLLPWGGPSLWAHLAGMALIPGTAWSIGIYGAIAEFAAREGEEPQMPCSDDQLLLRVRGGALSLRLLPGARLFELVGRTGQGKRLVLALHRARVKEAPAIGVTELGADTHALDSACRDARLFDLGVTRSVIRFCVRTGEPSLIALLRRAQGRDALDPAIGVIEALLACSPDRVVVSPVGRIEVAGPILRTDHSGPHTHLLPRLLTQRRELEPGFALPDGYLAGAVIYPPSAPAESQTGAPPGEAAQSVFGLTEHALGLVWPTDPWPT